MLFHIDGWLASDDFSYFKFVNPSVFEMSALYKC